MGRRNIVFTGWQHKAHRIEGLGPADGGLVLRISPGFAMSAIGIATETERLWCYESADEEQLEALARSHADCLRGMTRVYGFGGTRFVPGGAPSEIDVPYLRITHGARGLTAEVAMHRMEDGFDRIFNGIADADVGFLILEPLGSFIDLACHDCA